jgi:hypothetical protein
MGLNEVILTQLAQGYTEAPNVFSHHPAGYSLLRVHMVAYRKRQGRAFLARANEGGVLTQGLAGINRVTQARIDARKAKEGEREREGKELD